MTEGRRDISPGELLSEQEPGTRHREPGRAAASLRSQALGVKQAFNSRMQKGPDGGQMLELPSPPVQKAKFGFHWKF